MQADDECKPIKLEPDENGHIPVKIHYKLYPIIPFGKQYKGMLLDRTPHSYLKWLATGKIGYFWELNASYVLHGKPEPPTLEECVSITEYDARNLAVDAPYELRMEMRAIPGAEWSREARAYIVPKSGLKVLHKMFPLARVNGAVPRKVRETYAKQATLF